jgi:hypothetical protein
MSAAWVLDRLFGRRVAGDARRYLEAVAGEPLRASRGCSSGALRRLAAQGGPSVTLGETEWGEQVTVPVSELTQAHGLITGGSGSGKTMTALLIFAAMLEASDACPGGCAVVDGAKSDLFLGALYLVGKRLEELSRRDPSAASKFRRRVRIFDFAAADVITEFNLLARWPDAEPDGFAAHQAELLLDAIPDGDALRLAAAPLKTLVQVFSEPEVQMSVIDLIRALEDEPFLEGALARCRDAALVATMRRQFGTLSRSTRAALRRRLEALVSSRSVARMVAGRTAPDFRRLQDDGCFVLVNCAGANISGGLTRFLNTLVVSSFCRSIYGRRKPESGFVLMADEAQDLLGSSVMREHLSDAGRLARRYGTYLCLITQNLSAAVSDARRLSLLQTNVAWTWSGRGDPLDCGFLKPVLPATGRRPRPRRSPFEDPGLMSVAEERTLLLAEIANLPNRTGYLWLKGKATEAIKIRTRDLDIPQGRDLEQATLALRRDPTVGQRLSRKEYERMAAERAREGPPEQKSDLEATLAQAYRKSRLAREPKSQEREP